MDLDQILNGEPEAEEITEVSEVAEETKQETVESEQTEGPAGETNKEEGSTPEPDTDKETKWQFEAYKDEKRKRQEVERQLEELKQASAKPAKVPDIFEDQDGYTQHLANSVSQSLIMERSNISQFMAEREFGKEAVNEKLEAFKGLLANNPQIGEGIMSAVSPYHAMIEVVDKAEKLKKLENVDTFEAQIRSEIEAKVRAEYEQKAKSQQEKFGSVTPSLNNQASVSGRSKPIDDSLSSILGR